MTEIQPVTRLLAAAGFQGEPVVEPLEGGKNNRAFLVRLNGEKFFLKSYFWHPDDRRTRLDTEFRFSAFLWSRGIENIPRPFASDSEHQLGLYGFVPGRKLTKEEIGTSAIEQALDFFLAMNRFRAEAETLDLPKASEACFGVREQLKFIRERLERLKGIGKSEAIDIQARNFVMSELMPAWEKIETNILHFIRIEGEDFSRALSPSDFGFHNALRTPEGRIYFHDFEYAGWDDPSKAVCEFFCQPEVSVPLHFFEDFVEKVFGFLGDSAGIQKTRLLLPAYRIKWCCIILNEFLKGASLRRRFAQGQEDIYLQKAEQLAKAKAYLESVFVKYLSMDSE